MAIRDLTQLRHLAEVTRGTTPSSALSTMRVTSAQFTDTRETVPDEDIGTRRTRDQTRTLERAEGSISAALRYGNLDAMFESVLQNAWDVNGVTTGTDRLADGTTPKFFTFEKEIADVASSFHVWKGHGVDTLSVTIARESKVTCELATIGNAGATAAATAGTGAAVAPVTTAEMVAGDISAFTEGGSALSKVTNLNFQIANQLRAVHALGELGPEDIQAGRLQVTGTVRILFANFTLYNKFQDFTASSLKATIGDAAGNSYAFHFPEVRYGEGQILAGDGLNDSVYVEVGFTAQEDTTEDAVVVFERTAA